MSYVISLFDYTGTMVRPWVEAGYKAVIVDIQHPSGMTEEEGVIKVGADIRAGWMPPREMLDDVRCVFAFPPCDHLAVSGARWFKGKGLRKLALSVDLFATAAEVSEWIGAPYMIENPVSTISTYWRKPDHVFHPHHYTAYSPEDNYTKTTCIWTGNGFVMPEPHKNLLLPDPDDRIHKAPPGKDRKNFRSATPEGFSMAVYEANK